MMRVSSKRRRYSRKLKPDAFFQLNLDVLFLIVEYLHPKDLLNLSRTCKSLQEFLMDESSAFIWKTARHQVEGLPDCPTDLTEPEYADLVFDARCHGCGWSAKTVLWYIRRRYCQDCKSKWISLIDYSSCDEIIRDNDVLNSEELTIEKESAIWIDIEQMESFLDEYHQSSDKEQFLHDRKKQHDAIYSHASACEIWRDNQEWVRRKNLALRRQERHGRIFERLKQHGYGPEIEHFGQPHVQDSYESKSAFRTSKPLTDREWGRMWPEWLKIMEKLRSQRLEEVVYKPRRLSLAAEYEIYVTHPSPDTPAFDLLPHVTDIARFPPFRDILRAPEGTQMNDKPFSTVFAQLPALVDEWRKTLDVEIAALVKVPSCLPSGDVAAGQGVAYSSVTSAEPSQMNSDKLRLACASFRIGTGAFTHPEVFLLSMRDRCILNDSATEDDSERTGSIKDRFSIKFVEEAPYIIRACGLDPNVATADDMDRRNARLKCLRCNSVSAEGNIVMNWRNAIWHVTANRLRTHLFANELVTPSDPLPHWKLVGDDHIEAIQAVEHSVEKLPPEYTRCLLCLPSVGDALRHHTIAEHIIRCHNIGKEEIKQGIHYMPLGVSDSPPVVEMVEEGEQVTFRVSPRYELLRVPIPRGPRRGWMSYW